LQIIDNRQYNAGIPTLKEDAVMTPSATLQAATGSLYAGQPRTIVAGVKVKF
jgi:hypothetical protein